MRPKPDRILDYREFPILYVDDEIENLRIFELAFRREFSIISATNAEQALEMINERPVSIVLSDQRMPGMAGTDFLARVAELDPSTVRILVTAYGDASTLGAAINSGSIYRYIAKPWTPEDMRVTIRRGIEVYALDREREQLVRELTLLNQVSKRISQELELEALLAVLVDTVTEDFGYDAAAILIHQNKARALEWRKFSRNDNGVGERLREEEIAEKHAPLFFEGLLNGRTQVLSGEEILEMESPVRKWITEVAAESTLAIPLCGKDSLAGVLVVDNRRGGAEFSVEDRTLLEGLANQAVIAVENARLVEDLRRSREQVMRSDRLGTLGTLAAGIAHEINNPLVSIRTFMSMAPSKRRDDDGDFWGEYHALALEEVERIRRLVETMQGLGREAGNRSPRENLDIGEIAAQVVTLVQGEAAAKNLEIHSEIQEDLGEFVGIGDQIRQLMMNLLLNAIFAARVNGEVYLCASDSDEMKMLTIEVSDDGEGISDEEVERIFDPFYTTKGPDEGAGLGLMICHRIVREHGGMIEVDNRRESGVVFRVSLPRDGVIA